MGFVRTWWPPVVVGLVAAFLGIGVVEVAGSPAERAPVASAASRPTSVGPAAIETEDRGAGPAPAVADAPPARSPSLPSVAPEPSPAPTPSSTRRPPPVRAAAKPKPKPVRVPKPVPLPVPLPVIAPSATPSPTMAAPPLRRVVPIVRPRPAPVWPAQILDLRRWKLTLPAGRPGHPIEIRQPVLGSLASGSFIRLAPDRGVAFRAPVGGATTENSSYPRSELREMSSDGRREAAWTNATGRHIMTLDQAITATPRAKPHVVAGQIHDAEDDVVMIRLEGRRLFVESDGDDVGVLDPAYRLGSRFTVSILASPSGIHVAYNGRRTVRVRIVRDRLYFKAGCYPQSNPDHGDRPTAYGEVVIYALTVRHT